MIPDFTKAQCMSDKPAIEAQTRFRFHSFAQALR